MGSAFSDWAEATGATYIGANTSWEVIWLLVTVVLCVVALIMGSKHELDAYKKIGKNDE